MRSIGNIRCGIGEKDIYKANWYNKRAEHTLSPSYFFNHRESYFLFFLVVCGFSFLPSKAL